MEDDLLEVDDNFDVDEYEYEQQLKQRENPFASDTAAVKSLQHGGQGGLAGTSLKVASAFSHLGAMLSFALVLTLISYKGHYLPDGDYRNLQFGDFGLHPILMGTAFGLFMPLGVMSYSTWEYWLGLSHGAAKGLHALFHSLAVLFGSVGIASMWKTHDRVRHFQTAHSWIGIGAFALFVCQWLVGMLVYLNPWCAGKIKGCLMVPHVFVGITAFVLCMMAVASGPLALVFKPTTNSSDPTAGGTPVLQWEIGNAASVVASLTMVAVLLSVLEARRTGLGKKQM